MLWQRMIVSGSVLPVMMAIGIDRHASSDASISQTLSPLPAGISTSRQTISGISDLTCDKAVKASCAQSTLSPLRRQRNAIASTNSRSSSAISTAFCIEQPSLCAQMRRPRLFDPMLDRYHKSGEVVREVPRSELLQRDLP